MPQKNPKQNNSKNNQKTQKQTKNPHTYTHKKDTHFNLGPSPFTADPE